MMLAYGLTRDRLTLVLLRGEKACLALFAAADELATACRRRRYRK
jgi:hypothetical protein